MRRERGGGRGRTGSHVRSARAVALGARRPVRRFRRQASSRLPRTGRTCREPRGPIRRYVQTGMLYPCLRGFFRPPVSRPQDGPRGRQHSWLYPGLCRRQVSSRSAAERSIPPPHRSPTAGFLPWPVRPGWPGRQCLYRVALWRSAGRRAGAALLAVLSGQATLVAVATAPSMAGRVGHRRLWSTPSPTRDRQPGPARRQQRHTPPAPTIPGRMGCGTFGHMTSVQVFRQPGTSALAARDRHPQRRPSIAVTR